MKFRYGKKDWLTAGALTLVMALLFGLQLTRGVPYWGDDFAAYLSEGIAISEGKLAELAHINAGMHPSPLPAEADRGTLVYAWGFPLSLSLVHQFVGFDRADFGSLIYYKLPSLITFALMSGVLYLYYRRRFSMGLSAFLAGVFAAGSRLMPVVDHLYADVYFLFFCVLAFWLQECMEAAVTDASRKFLPFLQAVWLGLALFMVYETRLNGLTVVVIMAGSQILRIARQPGQYGARQVAACCLPYVVFFIARWLAECTFMPATSNLSDVGSVTVGKVFENIGYYIGVTAQYLYRLSMPVSLVLLPLLFVLLAMGIYVKGFRWENLHLTFFVLATYFVLVILPYVQGIRYLFNILPFLMMYMAYGGIHLYQWAQKKKPAWQWKRILAVLAAVVLVCTFGAALYQGITNQVQGGQPEKEDVYSKEAVDMYRYIQAQTPKDAVIAFIKPRALHLNTERISFRPGVNGRVLTEADYYLQCTYPIQDEAETHEQLRQNFSILEPVYENPSFVLYRVMPGE